MTSADELDHGRTLPRLGFDRGHVEVGDDFDDPLPQELLVSFSQLGAE